MNIFNGIDMTILDFIIIGIPMFSLGCLTTLVLLMNEKIKDENKKECIREKRIGYINYLINLVIRKRQEEIKIDVD